MAALLSVQGLSKQFGGRAAVQGLDLALDEGVITALVGPNGAGKTTFFNLVTGNLRADAGRVSLSGRAITGMAPHRVARLGVARSFQDLRLFTHMSVRDNVLASVERRAWLWQPAGVARARRRRRRRWSAPACRRSRGPGRCDLSYAEAKFLSLARILATGARIWLLDEPASGLDPASRSRFMRAAARRGGGGRHDLPDRAQPGHRDGPCRPHRLPRPRPQAGRGRAGGHHARPGAARDLFRRAAVTEALAARGLSAAYSGRRVLEEVDLVLRTRDGAVPDRA